MTFFSSVFKQVLFSPSAVPSFNAKSPEDTFLLILMGDLASFAEVMVVLGADLSWIFAFECVPSFAMPYFKAASFPEDKSRLHLRGEASFVEVWLLGADPSPFSKLEDVSLIAMPSFDTTSPADQYLVTLTGDSTDIAALLGVGTRTSSFVKQEFVSVSTFQSAAASPLEVLFFLPRKRGVRGVLVGVNFGIEDSLSAAAAW